MKQNTESLSITGHDGQPIANTFFRQSSESDHLAIVFPGRNYTCAMPLLYYTTNILLRLGADVLHVEYKYAKEFFKLPEEKQIEKFGFDVRAAFEVGGATRKHSRLTIIGKSMGTAALAILASDLSQFKRFAQVLSVWHTPLVADEDTFAQMKSWPYASLYSVGTADAHCWHPDRLSFLEKNNGWTGVTVEGAGHRMDIDGDVLGSLEGVKRVIAGVQRFLTS